VLDEPRNALDGIEVRRDELLIGNRDLILRFEKRDQLEHASRVDDAALEERVGIRELAIALSEEKVLDDELAYVRLNGWHVRSS